MNPSFWQSKRVLLTGHTGFKGSWLSLWLQSMGAKVQGLALEPPTSPSLFVEAKVAQGMVSKLADIRDFSTVQKVVGEFEPDIVIHMAAQPLVRYSYHEPIETYATNVMGTVHVLEAVRQVGSARAVVNVTTDKCYENKEWAWGYRESEPMGGFDPYSSSKACSELVTSAYRNAFYKDVGIAIASARAGNVIGGGDWAQDRLVPDVLRAFEQSAAVEIRYPDAIRPWQHVLEPLSGYMTLVERLWSDPDQFSEPWNFGPRDTDARPVSWIVDRLASQWGQGAHWRLAAGSHPHEAHHLKLDISKAQHQLGWQPKWDLATALNQTVAWHQAWLAGQDMRSFCMAQIQHYSSITP